MMCSCGMARVDQPRSLHSIDCVPAALKEQQEAKAFVRRMINRLGAGYHPDTPFNEYVTVGGWPQCQSPYKRGDPTFTPAEAEALQAEQDKYTAAGYDLCGFALEILAEGK